MSRFRRGGYLFVTWKGDHGPKHEHVYRDRRLLVIWDLENERPMSGRATRLIRKLIGRLESEGKL